jgi:hypothetical protein
MIALPAALSSSRPSFKRPSPQVRSISSFSSSRRFQAPLAADSGTPPQSIGRVRRCFREEVLTRSLPLCGCPEGRGPEGSTNGVMAPIPDPQETVDLQGKNCMGSMILALRGPQSARLAPAAARSNAPTGAWPYRSAWKEEGDDDRAPLPPLLCPGPYGQHGRRGACRRSAGLRHGLHAHASCGCGALGTGSRLAPEPRPATETEPRLQRLVFLPILSRRPDEQATDKHGGQDDHQAEKDRSRGIHPSKSCPPERLSTPTKRPITAARRLPELRHDPRFAKEHASPSERTCGRCRRDSISAL